MIVLGYICPRPSNNNNCPPSLPDCSQGDDKQGILLAGLTCEVKQEHKKFLVVKCLTMATTKAIFKVN